MTEAGRIVLATDPTAGKLLITSSSAPPVQSISANLPLALLRKAAPPVGIFAPCFGHPRFSISTSDDCSEVPSLENEMRGDIVGRVGSEVVNREGIPRSEDDIIPAGLDES